MTAIFISYARADRERIEPLANALKAAGFSVWWDTNIYGGAKFADEIARALSAADVAIVAWSHDSEKSEWVLDEASQARSENKLIPICLDALKPPLGFRQRQAINFDLWNGKPDTAEFTALLGSIRAMQSGDVADFEMPAAHKSTPKKYLAAAALLSVAILSGIILISRQREPVQTGPSTNVFAISEFKVFNQSDELGRISRGLVENLERTFSTNQIATSKLSDGDAADSNRPEFVIEGNVETDGEILTANIDVRQETSGLTLWSGHFKRAAADHQAFQKETARKIAEITRCASFSRSRMEDDSRPELLSLLWRTCEAFNGSGDLWDQLSELNRQILGIAPQYAESHSRYAWILAWSPTRQSTGEGAEQMRELAYKHAHNALALNPNDGQAYHALAMISDASMSLTQREHLFLEAINRDPDYVWSRAHYGHFLTSVGRLRDAIHYYEEFSRLFPLSPAFRTQAARRYAALGDIDQARFIVAEAKTNWTFEGEILFGARAVEYWYGDPEAARKSFGLRGAADPRRPCVERFLDARTKGEAIPLSELKQICSTHSGYGPHMYLSYFGYNDDFFQYVDEKIDAFNDANNRWSLFEGFAGSVRADARFMPLANRLGLIDYWLETDQWPDFCTEQKNLPYDCQEAALKAKEAAE